MIEHKVLVAVQPSRRRRHSKLRHGDSCRRSPAHDNAPRPERPDRSAVCDPLRRKVARMVRPSVYNGCQVSSHDNKPRLGRPAPVKKSRITKPSSRRPSKRPGRHISELSKIARYASSVALTLAQQQGALVDYLRGKRGKVKSCPK